MQPLLGAPVLESIQQQMKAEAEKLMASGKRTPHLAIIMVGNNGASETYVKKKLEQFASVGFLATLHRMEQNVSQDMLLDKVREINADKDVDGLIVQLPLPAHISADEVIAAIDPKKDVDGFHPANMGKLCIGHESFVPATPMGIVLMLRHYGIAVKGKHVVVVGRSNIVGRPISILMNNASSDGNATVTVCHSHTQNLKEICLQADVLIAAIGKPEFVTADMIKEGAVIIDVGITRIEDTTKKSGFSIKGDVHYESCAPKSSFITPVPGGVGITTVAALLMNTWKAYEKYSAV
jgi:methylenetetrahydrofolate dehydrogenase (NADP+)/methenyltetrahydrofolate cyclohydrolase